MLSVHHQILNTDTGVAQFAPNVVVMEPTTVTQEFFDRYAQALLARDADAIAGLYAVPSLIAFPGQSIPVSDQAQTRDFFAASFGQYDGVSEADPDIVVLAHSGHSIWADVTWSYDGQPRERFIYQLLDGPVGWQIGVLTPLDL